MRLAIAAALATTLLLSACPATTGSKVPKKATGVATAQTKATPKPADKALLSGLLKMDAHYVISAGGGNVISAGGGNVISAGGGNVISAGGGNVISAGGGNVISAGGGNYRVLADASVPVGTVLPAKGMVVVPVSLVTGKPVGEAVFTDERGHYEVAIPKAMAENVRLVAAVPGKSATDPIVTNRRLQYAVVAAPDAGSDVTIDEDTALITRYMRVIIRHQIRNAVQAAVWASDDQLGRYTPGFLKLRDKAKAIDLIGLPEDRQIAIYERFTDMTMASARLDTLKNEAGTEYIVPMLVGMLRDIREAATTKLVASPTFFAEQDYIKNQSGEGCVHEILKPADLGDFLVFKHLYRADLAALMVASQVAGSVGLGTSRNGEFLSSALAIRSAITNALKEPALTDSLVSVLDQAMTLPVAPAGSDCN
ncbi:MAG: hypothetical protein ACK46X_06695 [Candidatus Sericytochromatia bacterium]